MKATALDTAPSIVSNNLGRRVVSDFSELVKARLTLLVLLTTAVGYYLGAARPISLRGIFSCCFRNGAGRRGRGRA